MNSLTEYYTYGRCGIFAIALINKLAELNIPAELWALCKFTHPDLAFSKIRTIKNLNVLTIPEWEHVVVKIGNSYYDYTGLLDINNKIIEYKCDGAVLWDIESLIINMQLDHTEYDELQSMPINTYNTIELYEATKQLIVELWCKEYIPDIINTNTDTYNGA